jgi:1-acyl-sn-glycerol-3-phosphate acyltransferase
MRLGYYLIWFLFRVIFRLGFGCRILHPERFPKVGPVLIASNHASFMDPPLIGSSLPREITYLARDSLFAFGPFGRILTYINVIPVDRGGKSPKGLKIIASKLKEGLPVIVFPEGTRSSDGSLGEGKSGVGLLAIKSAVPVLPVRVFGTYEAYGRHMSLPRPSPIKIKFGDPLDLQPLREEAKNASKERLKAIYQEATEKIMAAISQIQPHRDCQQFAQD